MNYINLDQIKRHLNIDKDFHDDDEYLMDLQMVAVNSIQKHIDHEITDFEDEDGNLPQPLIHAMLLMIGTFYAKRESINFGGVSNEVPLSYDYLLSLYKDFDGPKCGTPNIY